MSQNNDIVQLQEGRPALPNPEWVNIRGDRHEIFRRVKAIIAGGRSLSDAEATALVDYAMTNDLNPTNGECYFIPGVGCVPGIAGYRRKAYEQIMAEARAAGKNWATFHIVFVKAMHEDAIFSDGDVAWKAILTDSLSSESWTKRMLDFMEQLRRINPQATFSELSDFSYRVVGAEPRWEAVGVVHKEEVFSRGDRPEAWDRNERAKKRAVKAVLKARFPGISIPGGAEMIDEPDIEPGLSVEPIHEITATATANVNLSETEINRQLGFEDEPQPVRSAQPAQQLSWKRNPKPLYDLLIQEGLAENPYQAQQRMKKCALSEYAPLDKLVEWNREYVRAKEYQKLDSDAAAAVANEKVK